MREWLFETKFQTAQDRYQLPVGIELEARIFEDYGVGEGPSVEETVPFFTPDGSPTFTMHELNNRHQAQVVRAYAFKVRKFGNAQSAQGAAVAQDTGIAGHFKLLSYGTLTRAIFMAHSFWPDESTVKLTIKNGLRIRRVHQRTPDDIVVCLRDWYNSFHGGASITFLESLQRTHEVSSNLQAHAMAQGWEARDKDYESKAFEWICSKYEGTFASSKMFKSCRVIMNILSKRAGFEDALLDMLGETTDFTNPTLSHVSVVLNLHAFISELAAASDNLDDDDMLQFALEGVKYAVPTGDALAEYKNPMVCSRPAAWLFDKHIPDMVKVFATAMADSVLYKTNAPPSKKPKSENVPPPSAAKKKRAAAAAKADQGRAKPLEAPILALPCGRDKKWIDDVACAVNSVVDSFGMKRAGPRVVRMKAVLYCFAWEFCWQAQVTISGKKIVAWSTLRAELQSLATKLRSNQSIGRQAPSLRALSQTRRSRSCRPSLTSLRRAGRWQRTRG